MNPTLLPWDSEWFGCNIGITTDPNVDTDMFDCTYLLVDAKETQTIHTAEAVGYRCMDVRITLECPVYSRRDFFADDTRTPTDDEVEEFALGSLEAFDGTRFWNDRKFPTERVARMYEHWFRKEHASNRVQCVDGGFVTVEHREGVSHIGLLAVHPDHRGTGVGTHLLEGVFYAAKGHESSMVRVVTQASNTAAVNLYVGYGFKIVSTELWFHRWK